MPAHKTAIIHPKSEIGEKVEIGPYALVEEDVVIGDGTEILSHVIIKKGTRIGKNCRIHHGAVLGDVPQDVKFEGEKSYLKIGDGNVIREYATLHRASGEGCETVIGDNNMLMAQTHVAHNCRVGNNVVMANLATIGGFVEVEDRVFMGGMAGVHQFVRIGAMAMVGGASVLFEDVPPYMTTAGGYRPCICGLNTVGLMRAGLSAETRAELKKAYRILYKSGIISIKQAVDKIRKELKQTAEVAHLLDFLTNTKRGTCRGKQE